MGKLRLLRFLESVWALERRLSAQLVDHGLTLSQFRLLLLLKDGEPQTATRLSVVLGITKATTTALLQDLADADLIAVARNPEDRRSVHVSLNATGNKRLREALDGLTVLERMLGRQLAPGVIEALDQLNLKNEQSR